MNILFVTSEVAPFVKVGGLADVVGALPKELARLGHDVRVVCPLYGSISRDGMEPDPGPFIVNLGDSPRYGRIWRTVLPGSRVPVYFIEHGGYFDRHEVYTGPWGSHADNGERFTFLSRAGLDLCFYLDWIPDVFHVHDWPTALLPVMLNTRERSGRLARAASVLTLHNMEHQGVFDRSLLRMAGIPETEFRPDSLESVGMVNMLKGGIYHATKLTTVSPSYAREIREPIGGCGLDAVLRFKAGDLVGILNGVDLEVWNPAVDPLIPARYSADDLSGKAVCKRELQRVFGLDPDPTVPVFGLISRFAHQKGLDLLRDAAGRILGGMRVQMVVLGSGDPGLQADFAEMPSRFPGRFGTTIGFDNTRAHLIEAGSDFFMMPSRFEPCGLNQMYSMIYGTPPVVRATGGLADSVEPYVEGTGKGTGFVFGDATTDALHDTIGWACSTWYDRPDDYRRVQLNGMKRDFSWRASAARYAEVYGWAVGG
jgi:starch synthase